MLHELFLYHHIRGGKKLTVKQGTVGIHHWAAYHCSRNFKNAFDFEPTRWLDDPRFDSDRREIVKPFSVGPKNCLGKQ